jgi:hypothetical protein
MSGLSEMDGRRFCRYRDNNNDGSLQKIMNELADSVFSLSDDALLAETGTDAEREAERTRIVLREAFQKLEHVNRHLSSLGHTINPNAWHRGWSGYRNTCATCGSFVSFKVTTGEMTGDALDARCPERDQYTSRRREASWR